MAKRLLPFSLLIAMIFAFSGCVVKQKVALDYKAQQRSATEQSYPKVNVIVNDERPYIKSGEKPGSYIGTYRGGFGNPFNVNTEGGVALSQLLQDDLLEELKALGFIEEGGDKTLVVDILEWKFDAFQNASFNYLLNVKVVDSAKTAVAQSDVVGKDIYIKGTFMGGGKAGVERDMPKLYSDIIKQIVRENKDILQALK
jgi:hypothetical protein